MAPPLLALQDIALTFGAAPLLAGAGLSVTAGDRVCLVGRNGSGKSTLLRIAAGLVQQDSGRRFAQPGATIRYLPQEPDFAGFATTLDYVESGLGDAAETDRYRAACLLDRLAAKTPKPCPAARRDGPPWPAFSPLNPTSYCWTSPPTILTCRVSSGLNRNLPACAPASC
jgi:energy-coupling factor transporter ATP-binding protein EcfA2